MNDPRVATAMTFVFAVLGLCAWAHFILQTFDGVTNLWIFATGVCLWLLAVANAKINELCKPKGA